MPLLARTFLFALTAAAVSGILACSQSPAPNSTPDAMSTVSAPPTATVPAPTSSTPPPTGSTPPPTGGDGALAGTWRSPSCGDRPYERVLTLNDGGTFSAEDRVSPCPPGAVCVWSGIVIRNGTYTRSGDTLTLTVSGTPPPQGKPFPAVLVIDPATKAPAERLNDGSLCVYRR